MSDNVTIPRKVLTDALALIDDFSRGIGKITLQDYSLMNDVPRAIQAALEAPEDGELKRLRDAAQPIVRAVSSLDCDLFFGTREAGIMIDGDQVPIELYGKYEDPDDAPDITIGDLVRLARAYGERVILIKAADERPEKPDE